MQLKIFQIDAFTDERFKGNYAAVIILDSWLPVPLMQSIATENNVSETAFVINTEVNTYEIRWFSPITEIAFCGHATLAASYVLFTENKACNELIFSAKAVGKLKVCRGKDGYIEMTFPSRMPKPNPQIPKELINGLSVRPNEVLQDQQAYYAVYADEEDVLSLQVSLDQIRKLAPYDVVATASSSEYDFISRYFWPANGGEEDPVTGSIHAGLAPYWSQKLGKKFLTAYQASERGGVLKCLVKESAVVISGKAVQYLEGTISV